MDNQMMDEQDCDYDNEPEENSKEPVVTKKATKKKQASKKKKKENSYGSMSNDSSRLRITGNRNITDPQLDEDMEEDEILQREMMN